MYRGGIRRFNTTQSLQAPKYSDTQDWLNVASVRWDGARSLTSSYI